MNNRRIDDLLAYLHALTKLDENDYKCYDEVKEVIAEIRRELFEEKVEVDVAELLSNLYPLTYEEAASILEGMEQGKIGRILRSIHHVPSTIKTGSGYGASGSTSKSITDNIRESYE